MASFNEQYIIDEDEDVLKHNWSSHNYAMLKNSLQKIKKEVYEKICKELTDENFGK